MADKEPVESKTGADETLKDVEPGNVDAQSLSVEEDKRILRRIDFW